MMERKVEIKTADGVADGYLYAPGAGAPGVIMYTDILGVRDTFRHMANRLAEAYGTRR